MSSCDTPRHSTKAMAPFSRALLNLAIALFIAHFPGFGNLAGASSHGVRGGRARALIGREVQLPRTLLRPLGWSGSAQSPCRVGLPTDPPIVLAFQHPRPHVPLSPPPFPPARMCVCVCACVFIKLHITAQSGPAILVII